MKTAWSHLPNAAHIDRVLASVKAHPEAWSAAWTTSRDAALGATRNVAGNAAWNAVPGAIAALIAWDHSIKYLDMAGEELQVWAILSDDPACILLLPAVIAFENINELEVA
jgi:hypothetical protein